MKISLRCHRRRRLSDAAGDRPQSALTRPFRQLV